MKTLYYILLVVLSLFGSVCFAQEKDSLQVNYGMSSKAITRQSEKKLDNNDNYCAQLIITAPEIMKYSFEATYKIGEVDYDEAHNTAYLYLSPNHRRTNIKIYHPEFASMNIDLGSLQSLQVYEMTITPIRTHVDKTRTLVMANVSLGGIANYGIMLAVVKKHGFYAKAKYNFVNIDDSGSCTDKGTIAGTNNYEYFTGKTDKSRYAFTAGFIGRFWNGWVEGSSQSIYGYAGLGYGAANYAWETVNDKWMINEDHSHEGLEAELGAIYRYKAFAVSAGIQTNSFQYTEFNFGIGLMF